MNVNTGYSHSKADRFGARLDRHTRYFNYIESKKNAIATIIKKTSLRIKSYDQEKLV